MRHRHAGGGGRVVRERGAKSGITSLRCALPISEQRSGPRRRPMARSAFPP